MSPDTFLLPRLLPRDRQLARVSAALQSLPMDKAWRVNISEEKAKRSDQQNRYLWGVVYAAITERLEGWRAEDVHEYCLGECYGWETVYGLGKRRLRPIRRSSRMSKTEFMDYVSWIQQRMAEHGIVIPDPEQVAA
jgi:hypothetical protein